MSSEDLERYESEIELQLYEEYKAVVPTFAFVVETERRFYLANDVSKRIVSENGGSHVEIELGDAWVWDMYRHNRFVSSVSIVTFRDVNVEELPKDDYEVPESDGD